MRERLIWVLWPSFTCAVIAVAAFFALIDPQQLYLFGAPVEYSTLGTYSFGFFAFWALTTLSSAFTGFFQAAADRGRDAPAARSGRSA